MNNKSTFTCDSVLRIQGSVFKMFKIAILPSHNLYQNIQAVCVCVCGGGGRKDGMGGMDMGLLIFQNALASYQGPYSLTFLNLE